MDSLRLPPLRFTSPNSSNELNCVLPPVTPPPRLSPTNTTPWYNCSTLPSPAPISPSAQLPNSNVAIQNGDDSKFSPVTRTPPSSIRPLPPATVLSAPMSVAEPAAIPRASYQAPQPYPSAAPAYASSSVPGQVSFPIPQYSQPTSSSASPGLRTYRSGASSSSLVVDRTIRHADSINDLPSIVMPPSYSNGKLPIAPLTPQQMEIQAQEQFPSHPQFLQGGPSTAPQLQPVVKSPVKKTVTTARGVRDVYACPYPNCQRVSTEQSNMKAHMRMHTGEKPYVCRSPGCMKAFRWKSSLTYHEKALHVKQRPFKCSPCRRSFVEKRKLRMHFDLCPVRRRGGDGEDGGGSIS